MTLERSQLQVLVALDRYGTVSAAANALFITQPAASQRLREAERRLGVALTERHGRSARLTAPARHLARRAAVAERVLVDAEAGTRWLDRATGPSVRVLMSVFDTAPWLPELQRVLAADGRRLEVVRGVPGGEAVALADGHADVCVMPGADAPRGFTSEMIRDDVLTAVVSPSDPLAERAEVTADDLAGCDYVTYSSLPESGNEYDAYFRPAEAYPASIVRVESTALILQLVGAGAGLTILPSWVAELEERAGRIVCRPLRPTVAVRWWLLAESGSSTDGLTEIATMLRSAAASAPE